MEETHSTQRPGVVVVKRKRKAPAKRMVAKRKNGLEGLLVAIVEAALAAKKLYTKIKPLVETRKQKKGISKRGKSK